MNIDSTTNTMSASTSTSTRVVRTLGAYEELYWLYSQTGSRNLVHAAEIEGGTTVDAWRKALDQVQRSQPLFSVCIDPNRGGRPYFRDVAGTSIPMRVLRGISANRWETEFAKEVCEPISGDIAPLVRTVLIHEPDRCIVIIAAHHSIADGMSMTVVLHDLVRALAGEVIARYPLLPSQEEALGVTGPSAPETQTGSGSSHAAPGTAVAVRTPDVEPPAIESLRVDAYLTTQLVSRARTERTTVHGAIGAAVIQARRMLSPEWNRRTARILSPISTRRTALVGDTCAMYFGGGVVSIAAGPQPDFWDLARHFTTELAAGRSRESLTIAAQVITDVVSQGLDPTRAMQFITRALEFNVLITNVGNLPFPSAYESERLRSIWGPALLTGIVDEQIIGVATLAENLHLLYTSYTPIRSFLRTVQMRLSEASDLPGKSG
jgi:hypothetical protein